MGSKRALLGNGLGALLENELTDAETFADLFSGSASVSWYVAENFDVKVLAVDLQKYSAVLARAVIERNAEVDGERLLSTWFERARQMLPSERFQDQIDEFESLGWSGARRRTLDRARDLSSHASPGSIARAYGGYYFSPAQAMWIDALRRSIPRGGSERWVALASLISAVAYCCASPGHTAQPFGGGAKSAKWLFQAWRRDFLAVLQSEVEALARKYARRPGEAKVGDAIRQARTLRNIDLAFVDPPYSGVQYSRFYHVLETIARGGCEEVSGTGRYPPPDQRPRSPFSVPNESAAAMNDLLEALADNSTRTIVTFPWTRASNGLSGRQIAEMATARFNVVRTRKSSAFSTLGGNLRSRDARLSRWEAMLVLEPRN